MDDSELADRLSRDLDGAFELLVRAHLDRLHGIALRILGNPADAEEITQDALVRAYRALAAWDAPRIRELRLRPWLATIVVNRCRSRRRRSVPPSMPLAAAPDRFREPAAGGDTDPALRALAGAERARLGVALAALPERYRVPVVLRHVDDLSYAELAAALGRPAGTVKAQVHRGLAMLRAALEAQEREELSA